MELDVLGLVAACSYALDCVETELVHVTSRHAKRVAYMSVCVAEQLGICGKDLQDLAVYVRRKFRAYRSRTARRNTCHAEPAAPSVAFGHLPRA